MISDSEPRFLGQQLPLFESFTPAIAHRRDLISIVIRVDSEELVSLNLFVNTVELHLYWIIRLDYPILVSPHLLRNIAMWHD